MNRTVMDALTGLFLLLALIVALLAVVSRSLLRQTLSRSYVAETWIPEAFVKAGDTIVFRKFRVGSVLDVDAHYWTHEHGGNWFRVRLGIDHEFGDAITDRFTTTVEVSPLGGLTGNTLILAPPGDEKPALPEGVARPVAGLEQSGVPLSKTPDGKTVVLEFRRPASLLDDLTAKVTHAVDEILPKVMSIVDTTDRLLKSLADPEGELFKTTASARALIDRLRDPQGPVETTLVAVRTNLDTLNAMQSDIRKVIGHADELIAGIQRGEGAVGGLIADPKMKEQVATLLSDAHALTVRLDPLVVNATATLANVEVATRELPKLLADLKSILGKLDLAANSLPGTAEDVRQTILEANRVLLAIQQLPLIRGNVAEPPAVEPLTLPASTGSGSH